MTAGLTARASAATVEPVKGARMAVYLAALGITHPGVTPPFVPAPREAHYQQGTAPGLPADAMGNAATDVATRTVWYQGTLDPFVRAHETGHLFDAESLSDGDRHYFQRVMQAPAGPWKTGTGLDGLKSPNEWFADYYATAATNIDVKHAGEAAYATIGPKRLKRFEQALARLGRRQQLAAYKP